jgi:hypothetical protein
LPRTPLGHHAGHPTCAYGGTALPTCAAKPVR